MDVSNIATVKMVQNILDGTTTPQQATKATQDGNGNVITTTYAQKESVTNLESCSTLIHSADGGFSAGINASVTGSGAIIGKNADASPSSSGASIGMGAYSNDGAGIGKNAVATGQNAVQLGTGTNSNDNTLQFLTYQICDANGNIPAERLSNVLDIIYPVGSIYINYSSSSSPASTIGGSWTQISTGQFLLASGNGYSLGATGGAKEVTLTTAQMPAHGHQIYNTNNGSNGSAYVAQNGTNLWGAADGTFSGWGAVNAGALRNTGGDEPHNNMPPYRVVSMWRRTA